MARFAISTLLLVFCLPALRAQTANFTDAERQFTLKIQPLFSAKCNGCHGDDPDEIKGDFSMLTRELLLAGGETFSTEVLVPGDAAKSFLMTSIRWADPDFEMPPKENDRLTEQQIAMVARWIGAGAPWPDAERQMAIREDEKSRKITEDGVLVETSGGLGDDWTYRRYQPEDLWAFQPVVKPEIRGSKAENPIDAFHRAKLAEAGFEPAPLADARTLIRRVSFDLTGLPPSPAEIAQFRDAWEKNADRAWEQLIDRLLDSPHYGERWAQHWLDVARYADTGGLSNDYERSNAWRYRDYVIRAFNQDKPYDRFVIEQLAGDELADAAVRKRVGGNPAKMRQAQFNGAYNPSEAEWIVATGFLRMGPWDNAMVKRAEARQIFLDDVVNSVGQTFLSTTMRCLKCHDHKFDPLPTRDYYRIYATFAATHMAERQVPLTGSENREGFGEGRDFVRGMLDFAVAEKQKLVHKRETAARAWFAEHNLEYANAAERKNLPDDVKPPRHVGLDHVEQGQLKVREQDEWIWTRRLERYEPMAQSVYNAAGTVNANARKLRISPKKQPGAKIESHILMGGALEAPGEPVTPGVLSALAVPAPGAPQDDPWALPTSADGRRLAFAKWVADPRNPLTARSIVNRVWQHHFVAPIARNPNNFGAKGAKPSHPKLLDWLAADLVENGWRLKRLHRLIVTSRAYRQANMHPKLAELRAKDPDNHLLAYFPPRRLTAEELRDAFLAVTGELNPKAGGLPIMPEINLEVALQPRMIQFSLAPAYQPSPTPSLRNRRTIYAYRVRGMADPFLELFNQPNPNDSCEFRDSAAVTPQAFTLLNSDVATDRSIAFALALETARSDVSGQIELAFQRALGRNPDSGEQTRLEAYVLAMRAYHAQITPPRPVYPTRITRSLVEEFSGRPFDYQEILPAFENYQPDPKAADVSPETRALADMCLLLLNANEFVYVN